MANIYDDLFQGTAGAVPEQNTAPANPYESLFSGAPSPAPEQPGEWDPTTGSQKIGKVVDMTKNAWENRDKVIDMVKTGADNLVAEGMRSLTGIASDIGTDDESSAKTFKSAYANANDQVEREAVIFNAKKFGIVKDEAKFVNYLKSGGTNKNVTDEQVERQAASRQEDEAKMSASGVANTSQARKSFFDIMLRSASGMTDVNAMLEPLDFSDKFASSYQKKWSELSSGPGGLSEQDAEFLKKYKATQESYIADVMKEAVKLRNLSSSSDFDFEAASEPVLNARRKELMRIELEYKERQGQVNSKKTDKLASLGMDALGSGDLISAVSDLGGAGVNMLTQGLNWAATSLSEFAEGTGGETLGLDTLSSDFAQSQRVDHLDASSGIGKRTARMISNGWNSLLDNSPDIAVAIADVVLATKGAGRAQKIVDESLRWLKTVEKTLDLMEDAVPVFSKDWAIGKAVRVAGEAAQNAVINPAFSSAFNVLAGGHTFNSEEAFQDMMGNAVGDSMFYLVLKPQFRTKAAKDIFDRIGIANANPDAFLSKEAIMAIQQGDIPATLAHITRQANAGIKDGAAYVPSPDEMPAAQQIKDMMAKYVTEGKVDATVASLAKQVSDQMDKALATGSKTVEKVAGENAAKAASDASARYASVVEGRAKPGTSEKTLSLGDVMASLFSFKDGKLLPRKLADVINRSASFKGVPEDVIAELQRAATTVGTDPKAVGKAFSAYVEALFKASSEGKIPEGFSFGRYFHSNGKWFDVITGADATEFLKNGDFTSGTKPLSAMLIERGVEREAALRVHDDFQSAFISGSYALSGETYTYLRSFFPGVAKFFEKSGTGYALKKRITSLSPMSELSKIAYGDKGIVSEMAESSKKAVDEAAALKSSEIESAADAVYRKTKAEADAAKRAAWAKKQPENAEKRSRTIDMRKAEEILGSLDKVAVVSEDIIHSGLDKVVARVAKKFESDTSPLMDGFKEIAIALRQDYSDLHKKAKGFNFSSIVAKLEKFLSPDYIKAVREAASGDPEVCRDLLISHIAKAFPRDRLLDFYNLDKLSLSRVNDLPVQTKLLESLVGKGFFGAEKVNPRSFLTSAPVLALWDKHLAKYSDGFTTLLTVFPQYKKNTLGNIRFSVEEGTVIRMAIGTTVMKGVGNAELNFAHEFGHHLNGYLSKEEWGNVLKSFFNAKMKRANELAASGLMTVKESFDLLGKKHATELQSDYRFSRVEEWFAENMAETITGTTSIKAFLEMLPVGIRKLVRFAIDFFRDLWGYRSAIKKEYEGYLTRLIDEADTLSKIKQPDKAVDIFRRSARASHALEQLDVSLAAGKEKSAKSDLLFKISTNVAAAVKGRYTGMDELKFEAIMRKAYKDLYDAKDSKMTPESLIAFHRAMSSGENIRAMLKAARNGDAQDMMRQFAATLSNTGRLPVTEGAKEFDDLATLPSKNPVYVMSESGYPAGSSTYSFTVKGNLKTSSISEALSKKGDTLIISSDVFNKLSEDDYAKIMDNWLDVRFTRQKLVLREDGKVETHSKDVQTLSGVFNRQGIAHEFEPEKYSSSAAIAAKDSDLRKDVARNREMTSEFLALQYGKEGRKGDAIFSTVEIVDKEIPLPVFFTKLRDLFNDTAYVKKMGWKIRNTQTKDVLAAMSALSTPGNIARAALVKNGIAEDVPGNFFVDISKYLKFAKSDKTGPLYDKLSETLSGEITFEAINDAVMKYAFLPDVSLAYARKDVGALMADILEGRTTLPKTSIDKLLSASWFRMLFGTPEEWMAKEYVKKVALASSNGDGEALREFIESYNETVADVALKNGYKESQDIAVIKTIEVLKAYGYLPESVSPAKAALAFASMEPDAYLGIGKHFTTWDRSQLKPSESKEQGFGHALEKMVKSITADVRPGKGSDLTDAEKEVMTALGESSGRDLQDQLAAAVWTHIEEIKESADKYMTDRYLVDIPSVGDVGVVGVPVASMWHPANYKIAAGPVKPFLEAAWSKSDGKNAEYLKQALLKELGIPHRSVVTNPRYSDAENKYFSPFADLYNFATGHSELGDFAEDFLFVGKGIGNLIDAVKSKRISVTVGDRTVYGDMIYNYSALADALRPGTKTTFLSDSGTRMTFTDKNWFRNPLFTGLVNDLEATTGIRLFANTPESTADNVLRALKDSVLSPTLGDIQVKSVVDIVSLKGKKIGKAALGVKDVVGGVKSKMDYESGVEDYAPIFKLGGDSEGVKAYREAIAYVKLRNSLANLVQKQEKVFEDDGFIHTPAFIEDLSKIFASSLDSLKGTKLEDIKLEKVKIESSLLPVYEAIEDDGVVTLGQVIGFTNGDTAERIGTKVLDIKNAYNQTGFSILDDGNEALKLTAEFTHNGKEYRIAVNGREHIVEELEKPAIISAKDPSVANFKSEDVITSQC